MSNKMILVNSELLERVAEQLEHYMGDLRSDECITLRTILDAPVQQPLATVLPPDPYDERDGAWFSQEDIKRLDSLPAGTKLYTNPVPVKQPVIELQSGDITQACNIRKNAMVILYSDVVASIEAAGLKVMKS